MLGKQLISFLKFAFLWLIFNYSIGSFNHISDPPRGVHQGAQCDRASLALNYYQNGMHFLTPEVHENRCKDGIVSCELPLANFLAACLYRIFGFNELWFRLLTFCFISLGMYALFLLFRMYVKTLVAYLILFIINSSPIILFYSTNFLPDASALGLVLIAWYLFFRLFIPHAYIPNLQNRIYLFIFIISLSFAIASKTTCIIQWMCMSGILFFSYFKRTKIELNHKKVMIISLLLVLVIPIVWQIWTRHLGKLHNSEFFMLHIPAMNSVNEFNEAWHVYLSNWPQETFRNPFYLIVFIFLILPVFFKKYLTPAFWTLSLLNTAGSLLFMTLMIKQFMYHDYYILCLLPAVFINWLLLASGITKLKSDFWWLKSLVFILLLLGFYFQFDSGKEKLKMRYTIGNYWEQSQQNPHEYRRFKLKMNKLGIDRKQCVLAGYDGAPNNVLYLLNLYGRRINRDFTEEQVEEAVSSIKPTYVFSNDSTFTNKIRPLFKNLILLENEENLSLFKAVY